MMQSSHSNASYIPIVQKTNPAALAPGSTPSSHQRSALHQSSSHQPNFKRKDGGRRIVVDSACNACRTRKSRCDGGRPVCGRCASKGVNCLYDVEAGESRLGSLKQRHSALVGKHHRLLETLRNAPMVEVSDVIERMRSGIEETLLYASLDEQRTRKEHRSLPTPDQTPILTLQTSSSKNNASRKEDLVDGSMQRIEHGHPIHHDTPQSPASGSPSLMQFALPLPAKTYFELALTAYNNAVGTLFYVYTPDQNNELFTSVFGPTGQTDVPDMVDLTTTDNSTLCQLCAVAALGSFYSNGAVSSSLAQNFYNIAKYLLDDIMQKDPFLAFKVCAILGMVNIVTKSTVAMAFFDVGLSMAQGCGLQSRDPPPGLSDAQWHDYRRVWRTLVLCSGWISSSVGILSSANWHAAHAALQQMDIDDVNHITDVVQTEMAKIAALKANILSKIAASTALSPSIVSTIRADLRAWHEQVPQVMQLTNIVTRGIEKQHQHKIYFVHLLYLGALMLLQRCIMSHWAMTGEGEHGPPVFVSTETLDGVRDGYMAARQSARILGLLRQEGGAVKCCWICIFQSYISGLIVIQESYQKLLHRTETQDNLDESLMLVEQSVNVLEFCATDDAVASRLLTSLKAHHSSLKVIKTSGIDSYMCQNNKEDQSSSRFAFSDPALTSAVGSSALHKSARDILRLICQPFEDLAVDEFGDNKGHSSWATATIDETAFGVDLDWRWGALGPNLNIPCQSSSFDAGVQTPNSDQAATCTFAPTTRRLGSEQLSRPSPDLAGLSDH